MKPAEVFRKTLNAYLKEKPRGFKGGLADALGINRVNLSHYLSGRDSFSEDRRIKIAEHLGFSYEEFISLGRKLLSDNGNEIRNFEIVQPNEKNEISLGIDPIICEHIEIVKKFRHKEQAKKINENLLVIDQNPEAMRRVEAYIEGLADGIRLSMGTPKTALPNQQDRQSGNLKNGTED